jgi:hypothetical protein
MEAHMVYSPPPISPSPHSPTSLEEGAAPLFISNHNDVT